jgi:hypothetical protein
LEIEGHWTPINELEQKMELHEKNCLYLEPKDRDLKLKRERQWLTYKKEDIK